MLRRSRTQSSLPRSEASGQSTAPTTPIPPAGSRRCPELRPRSQPPSPPSHHRRALPSSSERALACSQSATPTLGCQVCAAPRTREGRDDKEENGEFDAKSREIPAEIGKSNESMGTFPRVPSQDQFVFIQNWFILRRRRFLLDNCG